MNVFVWGVCLAVACCLVFNVYLFRTCKKDESFHEHPIERIGFIRMRCGYHRKALEAYHEELCDYWRVHPRSVEGDMLHEVVFNNANYDEVAERIR